jgi:hypothetical protein
VTAAAAAWGGMLMGLGIVTFVWLRLNKKREVRGGSGVVRSTYVQKIVL